MIEQRMDEQALLEKIRSRLPYTAKNGIVIEDACLEDGGRSVRLFFDIGGSEKLPTWLVMQVLRDR